MVVSVFSSHRYSDVQKSAHKLPHTPTNTLLEAL